MEIRNANAAGNAGAFATIVEDFDISAMGATKQWSLRDDLLGFNIVSIQVEYASLTGTKDATVELLQSNRAQAWDANGNVTLNTADGSQTIEAVDFSGRYIAALLTKNNCTGGTVTITVVVKAK